MKDELYVDHEVRIRMLEHLGRELNKKMNALITIALSSLVLPLLLKYFGA